MNLKGMLAGILTAQPYYEKPDGYHLNAEHDQIWLAATDKMMDAPDVQKMLEAGWHQEHDGRDYGKDMTVADYRSDESWTCYT